MTNKNETNSSYKYSDGVKRNVIYKYGKGVGIMVNALDNDSLPNKIHCVVNKNRLIIACVSTNE